ncbi:alpha/beta hydrolase family protein [Legionella rowbothamii]|uniref:alpha/beta hydrolase family protein n=1 Tax=Legionella rowbothamii TaxID=96229 RepID=UPI0010546525|nr:prolyl oligopeptidase family serine peptidase [Legionella rowbothamii]
MSMTLEQLIKLYILQKNAQTKNNTPDSKKLFADEYQRLMKDTPFQFTDKMAPALFKNQPQIPFVLFVPEHNGSEQPPAPLIIHTHGGPNVYMDKNKLHAEIAYFISQGFVVACPNYRGSTGYPEIGDKPLEWYKWEHECEDKYHIYGPQDVYAVTKYVQEMPFVDREKIYLRGGSFGSFINAHLLAGVKKGIYEPIFKGAHLSGGVKYPIPASMPDEVPLLITHSVHDDIAPFKDARIFMEKMLQKQLSFEAEDIVCNNLQIFISQSGDHHLIAPELQLQDEGSNAYQELRSYLSHTTHFIHALADNSKYQPIDTYDQFQAIMADKDPLIDPAHEVLQRAYGYQLSRELAQRTLPKEYAPVETTESPAYSGPTRALLKLQLGDDFAGNLHTDLTTYLKSHFHPINWSSMSPRREKIGDAGLQICANSDFFKQIIKAIEQEETFLQQHPNHMVMYHTAEPNSLQLYSFINLWQAILTNKSSATLPIIQELRLYDFMKKAFDDVDVFLLKMRRRKTDQEIFNNTPGFQERAIACNPSLISSAHTTSSSSLWWYFNAKENDRTPTERIICDMLKLLGIHSEERVARYIQLFNREKNRETSLTQALLQQIFVPYDIAERSAYLCQLWGEEFKENEINLASPSTIRELIEDPIALEQKLRTHQGVFTNFGECEGFGDTQDGFNYANSLQLRYLPRTHKDIVSVSYFRDQDAHQDFVTALSQLILEDYADFLAYGSSLPDFIIPDAETSKQELISQSKLCFFGPKSRVNLYALSLQQQELYKGLIQNPSKELYGGIIEIARDSKAQIQAELRKMHDGNISPHPIFPFSLCLYLGGYTYYDLLKEAAIATILNGYSEEFNQYAQQEYQFLMEQIELFSIPSSIKHQTMYGATYAELYRLFYDRIRRYKFDPQKHQFNQPHRACDEEYLFNMELNSAIETVLKHARLAKEFGYDHDVDQRIKTGIY